MRIPNRKHTPTHPMARSSSVLPMRKESAGFILFEAVVALTILAFGLLGAARIHARSTAQITEAQTRAKASLLVDELLSTALVDTGNPGCYTLPAEGTCGSPIARETADAWAARVEQSLPGPVATKSIHDAATGRLVVSVSWMGKATGDERYLEAATDVRK